MATDGDADYDALLAALGLADWSGALEGVGAAEAWLRAAPPGDPRIDDVVSILVELARHPKWEIRRRVANAAAQALHPAFEHALARLATDENTRVRQAAEHAALRRRDWQNASTLGKQHEDRINATLDDIEVRFGLRGRDAVKRASQQIANTFARELYHEVIKLLSPLAISAERLQNQLLSGDTTRETLAQDAVKIGHRVAHVRAVLDAMRGYTQHPQLTFARESMKDVLSEAASLVRDGEFKKLAPPIDVQVDPEVVADVSRHRFVQALTNVLTNAIESYDSSEHMAPIVVRADSLEGRVGISVEDSGCGMSTEALADATVLFATSKKNGTGFGLPLAIKIVESEHNGRLTLESAKGRGTVVRVVIPIRQNRDRP